MLQKKILIIDDEEYFCKMVKRNLEITGSFLVAIATNGKRGLSIAKKDKPDVIILDVMMPKMNGFEVLKRLKKDIDTISIPVIMLTAKGDQESYMQAAQLYDELYLLKPIDAPTLKTKIEEVIKRRSN
ncbi:MAG: response regulator [Candidatus Omnitrophota bacterium]|nr:response regulator [Candidatus Omnitrophota bacterium]